MILVFLEKGDFHNKLVIEDQELFQSRIIENTFCGIDLNGNDAEEKLKKFFMENKVTSLHDFEEGYVLDFYIADDDVVFIYDEQKLKRENSEKTYELYCSIGLFDDLSQIETGCCGRDEDESELLASFKTEEEAIEALKKHPSTVERRDGQYEVKEYFVSVVIYDEYGDPDFITDQIEQELDF